MNIQGSEICPCATSCIFVFHFHRYAWLGRIGAMTTSSCLNTGFLIRRQNKLIFLEGSAFPDSFIKVQNSSGFHGKLCIAGENP
ncbi:MAG TPA: hypothetical protein DCP92_12235 [Nitrospiraceae bacterium]|nr:hypothetical protein [Nitrospiraceae bacterium]